ncbi:MEDS domain-containing protein [Streptosporangium sp. NPDC002721]|uniref:MEDS domain-containing protein n=1 Tax=Streptosporangium sp. NPDC002721 TaxID=3366188 RepID=UPI0036BA040C
MRHVKDVKLGDHLCLAFSHEDEQREVASAFVSAGLERRERVVYFTDGAPGRVRHWLEEAGIDVTSAMRTGQFDVVSSDDGYLPSGRFDADTMITTLRREIEASLEAGFTGFRVSGEMSWALRDAPGVEQLEQYERRVTALFAEGLSAAICQYDTRLFPADRLDALAGGHPDDVRMNALFHDGQLRVVPSFDAAGDRVLRVIGTVDHRNTTVLSDILDADSSADIRLDMAGLEFIDVAGLRDLAHAAARLPRGRRLLVLNLAPMLGEVVRLVGWDRTPGLIIDPEALPA